MKKIIIYIIIICPLSVYPQMGLDSIKWKQREYYYDQYLQIRDTMTSNTWFNYKYIIDNLEEVVKIDNEIINNRVVKDDDSLLILERKNINLINQVNELENKNTLLKDETTQTERSKQKLIIVIIAIAILFYIVLVILFLNIRKIKINRKKIKLLEDELKTISKEKETIEGLFRDEKRSNEVMQEDLDEFVGKYYELSVKLDDLRNKLKKEIDLRKANEKELRKLLDKLNEAEESNK